MIYNPSIKAFMSIPKTPENKPAIERLRRKCTYTNYDYMSGDKVVTTVYYENEKVFVIPRYMYRLVNEELSNLTDYRIKGKDLNIESKVIPRDDVQDRAIKEIVSNKGICIALPPGKGKTVVTMGALGIIKKKACIIVHKTDLANQWVRESSLFTTINPDRVCILRSSHLDEDLEKDFVICTSQMILSLLSRNDLNSIITKFHKADFGVLVGDEAHITMSANKFSEANKLFPVERTIGLSATPRRSDGMTDVIFGHMGDYMFSDLKYDLIPTVYQIMCDMDFGKTERWMKWAGKFQRSRYVKKLADKPEYLELITILTKVLYDKGRHIVQLSDQIKLIEEIKVKCLEKYPDMDIESYHAAKKQKTNKRTKVVTGVNYKDHRVITSNYQLLKDGIDHPIWDCLLYSSPISNDVAIEQSVGRITRLYDGKPIPIVIDIMDVHRKETERYGETRETLYIQRGFKVVKIDLRGKSPKEAYVILNERIQNENISS